VTWNRNVGLQWYSVGLAILVLSQSWLGARLFELRAMRPVNVADAA